MNKTYSAKPSEVTRQWYIVDASGQTLGRLATVVATYLTGKHKPMFTTHIDCGDSIIVTHAAKIKVTGNKLVDKKYYRYSGFPGGIYETSLEDQLKKDPTKVITAAVKGMLPKNRLQDRRLERLMVYSTGTHPHAPQQPKPLPLSSRASVEGTNKPKETK